MPMPQARRSPRNSLHVFSARKTAAGFPGQPPSPPAALSPPPESPATLSSPALQTPAPGSAADPSLFPVSSSSLAAPPAPLPDTPGSAHQTQPAPTTASVPSNAMGRTPSCQKD